MLMIEDIFQGNGINIKKDGIYGDISDYGEQELEVRVRKKLLQIILIIILIIFQSITVSLLWTKR